MGVGRRMKKQGPPAPLDESKITILKKRKASEAESKPASDKKRRTAKADDETRKSKPKTKANQITNGKAKNGASRPERSTRQKKNHPKNPAQFFESDDELSSDHDAEDLMGDEFDDLDGVSDGSVGSKDEGSVVDDDSVFDSEEDHARETLFSEDEDVSDAEEQLTAANIEGLSKKLDMQRQAEEEEAQRDLQESAMQTNIAGDRPDVFGDEGARPGLAPDLQFLRTRITDTIRILGDLAKLGQPGKSRTDYVDLLISDICTYYGYTPFLAEKLFSLFTPMEAFAFFEANETPRPVVLRTNTLRTNRRSLAQALINRGVVLEPVGKWSKVGLQVFESAVPLGATPEYLAGHYILQAASSFLPVMALAPQPHERVLDMAAAPGGKSTYISALMRNTGCVIANDASKVRAKGLIGNIHRLGCKNTIVTNLDARTAFPKALGGFDRVLLDAPCTGTGVISKDPSVKTSKTERDFLAIPHMQRQLLLAAIDSTDHSSKTGGYIVYSTCSVTVEENEAVVQYVLRKRPNVKIVDTGLGNFGSEGFKSYMGKQFDAKMNLTRRYFPHRENVDGFFVCKLKKTGPSPASKAGASASGTAAPKADGLAETNGDEIIDKTPITNEDGTTIETPGDTFGPFEDDADAEIIARAERNRLRRKGINPKAVLDKSKADGSAGEKKDGTEVKEKTDKETASQKSHGKDSKKKPSNGQQKDSNKSSSAKSKKAKQ
ncbi:hypothetical protein DTO166G4_7222 [Paecilomyces variotii]|uniref:Nucleolar protein 2 n=1 Tax=Byssochlamys spectabilis TaxID=264951 RepID=A0A443HJB3_BYSSP|nr:putative nucleolar RNA methyltransferase [Paecilomyces variotii]KAJ9191312.1 hypothetical protein DTO032I3_8892 [Paecilomyces variotii]KAJ9196612.1 hypothetical protein DTO164E3_6142 [Paecilomyces variotii]KAJ9211196.1 hypothetical protein DTO166G4_7222 [Paecilomyces variotii]KAJ9221643.1 hypothetical protein DTO169C6_5968 [Paecilomyces variotii]KAJ9231329.1 hypothetical protein DTO166G5_6808 [Paecilomyces variotii]